MRFNQKFDDMVHAELTELGFRHKLTSTFRSGSINGFIYSRVVDSHLLEIKYSYDDVDSISFYLDDTRNRLIHIGIDNTYVSLLFKNIYIMFPRFKHYKGNDGILNRICDDLGNISFSESIINGWTEMPNMLWQKNNGFNILKIKFNAGKKKFELFANESFISSDNDKTKLMEYAKDNFKC